ncbi:hypothetical protein D3C80_1228310 [compost metagenome]
MKQQVKILDQPADNGRIKGIRLSGQLQLDPGQLHGMLQEMNAVRQLLQDEPGITAAGGQLLQSVLKAKNIGLKLIKLDRAELPGNAHVIQPAAQQHRQLGIIGPQGAGLQLVIISKVKQQLSGLSRAVPENGAVQVSGHIGLQVVPNIPGQRGPVYVSGIADRQMLPMAEIAPVGNEIADCPVFLAMNSCTAQIGQHIVRAAGYGIPGACSRADIERNLRLAELQGIGFERMLRTVAPFHGNDILRQLRNQLGMLDNDIAPELHFFTPGSDKLMNFKQEGQV